MTKLLRTCLLIAGSLCVLALAGCGEDTEAKNEYVNALNKMQTDFSANIGKIGTAASAAPKDAQSGFNDIAAEVDKLVEQIKALEPPDEVRALHDQLAEQVAEFGDVLRKAGRSLSGNDPQKLAAAQSEFTTDATQIGTRVSQTIADINRQLQE